MTALIKKGAQIDAFGVGTALATPGDAPHLNMVYKLVEVERDGRVHEAAKLTQAKVTYPGKKQVFRTTDAHGQFVSDRIALASEMVAHAEPLLIEVMRGGKRVVKPERTLESRERCRASLAKLPERYRQLRRDVVYPVSYSERLEKLLEKLKKRVSRGKAT